MKKKGLHEESGFENDTWLKTFLIRQHTATELKNNIKWGYNLKLMQNFWSLTFNYFVPIPLQSKCHVIIFMVTISEPLLSSKQVIRGQEKTKVFSEPRY